MSDFDNILPEGVKMYKTQVEEWPELGAWLVAADLSYYQVANGWDFTTKLSKDLTDKLSTVR